MDAKALSSSPGIPGGFLKEFGDPIFLVHMHDTKRRGLHPWDGQTSDRHVSRLIHVLAQHDFVVHLVDMIAGQNQHVIHIITVNDINVLRHRIRCSQVPLHFRHPLRRRQDVQILVPFSAKKVPAPLAMTDQ
jgi:hypothetical protein